MGDHMKRRVTDVDKTQEIEAMIMKEEDEKHRTLLLVVHSLNTGIREQTAALRTFQDELIQHQKRFEEYIQQQQARDTKVESFINQGKGVKMALGLGARILLAAFALIQAALLAVGSHYASEMDDLQTMAQANLVQHAELYARMKLQPPEMIHKDAKK
ncbi:MAG TPA: hypothetical protein VIY48_17080 [Candidatus Paceibacterota bacterium]